jgi:predicted RecB family nuclease
MHRVGEKLVWSASDLIGFLACGHLTSLELLALDGRVERPEVVDLSMAAVAKRGDQHEAAYLERLKHEKTVVEIPKGARNAQELRLAEQKTLEAMKQGAEVIYQATFFDERGRYAFRGHADFLFRVDRPSAFGPWSYEVADTKLSRTVKAKALLQMCAYSEQLERLQKNAPESMHVITGDLERHAYRVADFSAYFRSARARFLDLLQNGPGASYPEPVEHCGFCGWSEACEQRWEKDDHLSLVAGMRKDQAKKLRAHGISTVAQLGVLSPNQKIEGIAAPTLERLREQARMQLLQRRDGKVRYELLSTIEPERGLCLLPPPSPGDVFFDMEGDPLVEGGLEYLFGYVTLEKGKSKFSSLWAHSRAEEKKAFEAFIDFVVKRRQRHPDLHVFHYAAYEVSAMKRLACVHDTRLDEVDDLLRGRVFVDLFQVVRQSLRISQDSYSIKKLEPLYMPKREGEVKDAASSIVAYEQYLETRDAALLADIEDYNRVDCESTWLLRNWLEERRNEAAGRGSDLPRPAPGQAQSEEAQELASEISALEAALLAGVPEEPSQRTAEQQGLWLLAQLLDWHRREAKPEWWAFFERCAMTDEELFDDSEALSGLVPERRQKVKQSVVVTFRFDPSQDHKMREGLSVVDPRTGKGCGDIHRIDNDQGELDLRLKRNAPEPTALIPGGPINTSVQRDAIRRVAEWVRQGGVDSQGKYRAVRDLLLRKTPHISGARRGLELISPGESMLDGCRRLALGLNESYLPLQGPPGAGKTFTGARMAVALVKAGKRVGVTANSHKVIGNLLAEICRVAAEEKPELRVLQKASEEDRLDHRFVTATDSASECEQLFSQFQVLAGTSWLFARPGLEEAVDVLFVDEAGQLSLANAVAVGTAAKNLVLLGDPQQLAQPQKGIHPEGAEASALGHVLQGRPTVPPEAGVFLGTTYRMHPEVCAFVSNAVYEGRLLAEPGCKNQLVGSKEPLFDGVGLRFVPVLHAGNRSYSPEEVTEVVARYRQLLGSAWTDKKQKKRKLGAGDILVVAPYNAHVSRLKEALGSGARVGTVDKFQGQEAPVTLYSMATSNAEEVPRTLEFLYELNRLNVAVSRAQGLSIIVASPDLLKASCRTPEQMRLVNALCLFAERSDVPQVQVPVQ